jgi:uncharacterized protein (DUF427 family)
MPRAIRDGVVIAESDKTVQIEGNHYFPPGSINWEYLRENDAVSVCPWKGVATYYDVVMGGKVIDSAGWTYRAPSNAAARIRDYVAFYQRFAFFGKVNIEG